MRSAWNLTWGEHRRLEAPLRVRRLERLITEQTGNTFDVMLFYECMLADERARAQGPIAMAGGEDVTAPGDSPVKTNDISSGEQDFGQIYSEEEVSEGKAPNNAADSEEEDSNSTELTGSDDSDEESDAEEQLRNTHAALYSQYVKARNNKGTTSSKYEDFPREIPEPEYMKLHPETRAQKIAEVFRQAAEEIFNSAIKDALLVNAQQVLIIGLMLAEARQKQAQECEDKETHLEARRETLQARNKTLEAGNEALEAQIMTLEARVIELRAQLESLKVKKAVREPDLSTLTAAELFELLQSVVEAFGKFLLLDQGFPKTVI